MLSKKVIEYLQEEGYYDETPDLEYIEALRALGISPDDEIGQFNLSTNTITIEGSHGSIYNVCWFMVNSSYRESMTSLQEALKMPTSYIPLDSFEAGGGFLYDRLSKQVIELEVGSSLIAFQHGRLRPQWTSFNDFLEWFFGL